MTTHTKGPWIPAVADGGALIIGPDGYAICALPCFARPLAENLANAELIAMAPDSLFRLAELAGALRNGNDDDVVAALDEAETLIDLLAESGVTVGEPS